MTKKKEAVKESASFQDIALNQIKPNPANPRKRGFEGPEFDELVLSIRSVGVLEPVLVRPKGKGFELVAGERRFRACCAIVAADVGHLKSTSTIPAIIRELDDDQAFEVLMIENLQRADLSELEEAEGFKHWIDRRGPDSLEDLAQRTGIQPGYIRRRIAVLELPEKALKAWGNGKLRYSHLELMIRIQDKKQRNELLEMALNGNWSAKELRRRIENSSPSLKKALFDPDAEGCPQCFHNTDRQKTLFALDDIDHATCMKTDCFKQKQNNWLLANWKSCELRRKFKTNGFIFEDRKSRQAGESFYSQKPFAECKDCKSFVSLIEIDGSPMYASSGRYCLDPKCMSALGKKRSAEKRREKTPAPGSGAEGQNDTPPGDEPRVAWHGEFFREEFYKTALPPRILELDPLDESALRIAIMAMINLAGYNVDLEACLQKYLGLKKQRYMSGEQVLQELSSDKLKAATGSHHAVKLAALLLHLSHRVIMSGSSDAADRRAVAEHIGIDLSKEWRITDEYLQKKTKAEIMDIGVKCGVFAQDAAQTYLFEKLLKKRGKFDSCKKPELIELFLKSGVDLAGVVPEEILRRPEPRSPAYEEDDVPTCRVCGCTEDDCSECIEAAGEPCHWVEPDLCSRCAVESDLTATKAA